MPSALPAPDAPEDPSGAPAAEEKLARFELARDTVAGVPRPPVRASLSSSLAETASESSDSAVEEGEFLATARFTRDRPDLLELLPAVGVPFLREDDDADGVPDLRTVPDALDVARGPALPARWTFVLAVLALGVPGPRDECLASPLDVAGAFPSPLFDRPIARLVDGPAEPSRAWRFRIMVAAGVAGAEAEMCCCDWAPRIWELITRSWVPFASGVRAAVTGFVPLTARRVEFVTLASLGRIKDGSSSGSVKPGSPRS